jgi:tetratricopeptide (TPR) repeat protein
MDDWTEAESHANRAQAFLEVGDWDRALRELRQALRVNPDQGDWLFGMGVALDALQRHDEAASCFEQVLTVEGADIETLLHLANSLLKARKYRRAIKVLTEVNKLDPNCEHGYCYRIKAYALLGDHEQAEHMFYLAQMIDDRCPRCFDHIAESLAQRGQLERAVWCWQQTIQIDPLHEDAHAKLALVYWRQGRLQRAKEFYNRQIDLDPEDTSSLLAMSQLLIEMNQTEDASDCLRHLLDIDPTESQAHLHLAELALDRDDPSAAEHHLNTAQKLDPTKPGTYLRRAQLAKLRGEDDAARRCLRMETRREGHGPVLALELARALLDAQLPAPAMPILFQLLLDDDQPLDRPQCAAAHLYRGVAWMMNGQFKRGIADCRLALKLDPTNVLALHNAVAGYAHVGQLRRAQAMIRRARAGRPDDRHLHLLERSIRWSWLIRRLRPNRPIIKPYPWVTDGE